MSLKTILIKRGNKIDLPTLLPGELGFCEDTKELFIGSLTGNRNITDAYTKEEILSIIEDNTLYTLTKLNNSVYDASFSDAEYIQIAFNGIEKAILNTEILNNTPSGTSIDYLLDTFEFDATTIPVIIDATQKVSSDTVTKFLDLRQSYFADGDATMSIIINGVEHVIEEIEIYTDSMLEDSYVNMYLPDSDTHFQFSYAGIIDETGLMPDANSTLTFNISAYSGEIILKLYRQTESWSIYMNNLNSTDIITIAAVHKTGLLSTIYDKTEVYNKVEVDKLITTEILYADLVQLMSHRALKIGAQYRIIDYETVVSPEIENVRSANKLFDIIVTPISGSSLSSLAIAVPSKRPGASYFIGAWSIEYTLTNYAWVGSAGKGTILRMTDSNNNSLPYDFKNIQFYIDPSRLTAIGLSAHIASDNYYYTFSRLLSSASNDASSLTNVYNNYLERISYSAGYHSPAEYASVFISVSGEKINNNRFASLRNSILADCYNNTVTHMASCDMRKLMGNNINTINNVISTGTFQRNVIQLQMQQSQFASFIDNVVGYIERMTFITARNNHIESMINCKVGDEFNYNTLHCTLVNVIFGNSAEDLFTHFVGNTWLGNMQFNTIVNRPVLYGTSNSNKGILIQQADSQTLAWFSYYNNAGTFIEGNVTV